MVTARKWTLCDRNCYQGESGANKYHTFSLDVCSSSQNQYGRIRWVETFCSRAIIAKSSLKISPLNAMDYFKLSFFGTFLVAFNTLESKAMTLVQLKCTRNILIFLSLFTYFHGAFNFRLNDTMPRLSTSNLTRQGANKYPPRKQN